MQTIDYPYLLEKYRGIWNNRKLDSDLNPKDVLEEAIDRDLKDENSHPRARRDLMEKYYLSTKRIIESDLSAENKIFLIQLHIERTEEIKQTKG